MSAFFEKVQLLITRYWLIGSTFIIAVLSFLLYRQNTKIADLQRQAILTKLDNQLNDAAQKSQRSEEEYNASIEKFRKLRDHFDSLYGPPKG